MARCAYDCGNETTDKAPLCPECDKAFRLTRLDYLENHRRWMDESVYDPETDRPPRWLLTDAECFDIEARLAGALLEAPIGVDAQKAALDTLVELAAEAEEAGGNPGWGVRKIYQPQGWDSHAGEFEAWTLGSEFAADIPAPFSRASRAELQEAKAWYAANPHWAKALPGSQEHMFRPKGIVEAGAACGAKRGTTPGASRHSRAGELPCDPCRKARTEDQRKRRTEKREQFSAAA